MIGVFDSGLGGLTILHALITELPQYSYLYFGDTLHAPYGEKDRRDIIELTQQGVDYLFREGAELVILGCNTASAAALRHLQQNWLPKAHPTKKLLGIVVPTIEQISGSKWGYINPITTPISDEVFTVGVLATPATVASNAYPHEVHKRNPSIHVVQQSCPKLADAIEQEDKEESRRLVKEYIDELQAHAPDLKAVLLGCTHYELIADEIGKQLGASITLYHQPSMVARSLGEYLNRHEDIEVKLDKEGKRLFYTSKGMESGDVIREYFEEGIVYSN